MLLTKRLHGSLQKSGGCVLDWLGKDNNLPQKPMESPRVDGINLGKSSGHGGCGHVFHATDDAGAAYTVKIFDDSAICQPLLKEMTERLHQGGWPRGVMPLLAADWAKANLLWVMPSFMDRSGDGEPIPRNLQRKLAEHPGKETWQLVRKIASALAEMHHRKVVHGNLKPGNVFFDDSGEVLLTDWTQGNMPMVAVSNFTDAVLYQSPEQLRDPSKYTDEMAYRWDVFSFGVLAYRLLTGRFPRCHDTFVQVAPAAGMSHRDGIKADLTKIARNLELHEAVDWPDEAKNDLELKFRDLIKNCLHLVPILRPRSMIEVVEGFSAAEQPILAESELSNLLNQRRRADRRTWKIFYFAGASVAAALVIAGLWYLSNQRFLYESNQWQNEIAGLELQLHQANKILRAAEGEAQSAQRALIYEKDLGLARLESSRLIGDRLFSWAMEKGNRNLPPLDGRELRLKRLERYFEDFLTRTIDQAPLEDERARAKLQLAEISIARGDATLASKRLGEALVAWSNLPQDAELRFRMATNALFLALLRQSTGDPMAAEAFINARKALQEIPPSEVDADRLNQLLATLDFQEAKILAANGNQAAALDQLLRATETLNRIADQRPDVAILRSELAACYLSSATILEGMGKLGDAREVRSLASLELVRLLKDDPGSFQIRLDLAGCYGGMAESAILAGDITGAETISNEAMKLLDVLVVEQPDNATAISRKASQLGLRAGIFRDRGFGAEAMQHYDEGIRMLEGVRTSTPDDGVSAFRLALLWWQKGRMLGMQGDHPQEIATIRKANDLLGSLEASRQESGPNPEQLQSSSAYMFGDLGHAYQMTGRKPEASTAFSSAISLWEGLLASRPQNEEYSEGLAWCQQRLDDLK